MSTSSTLPRYSVLVPIANGCEEIETVSIIDTLRRAQCDVTVASIESSKIITASRGVKIEADILFPELPTAPKQYGNDGQSGGQGLGGVQNATCGSGSHTPWHAILLPGGLKGAQALSAHEGLINWIRVQKSCGKLYGAICASPAVALGKHQLLGEFFTCHPSVADQVGLSSDSIHRGPRVVYDAAANCVTSIGPGSAIEFATQVAVIARGREWVEKEMLPGMMVSFTLPVAPEKNSKL